MQEGILCHDRQYVGITLTLFKYVFILLFCDILDYYAEVFGIVGDNTNYYCIYLM